MQSLAINPTTALAPRAALLSRINAKYRPAFASASDRMLGFYVSTLTLHGLPLDGCTPLHDEAAHLLTAAARAAAAGRT